MDFDKLLQQRQAKEATAAEPPAPPAPAKPRATRQRAKVADSKRASWLMRAWYVQPETASRLRAYVNRQQEAGQTIDASDVVDEAIAAWLKRKGA